LGNDRSQVVNVWQSFDWKLQYEQVSRASLFNQLGAIQSELGPLMVIVNPNAVD